jgi:CpeT protein
MKRFTYIITLLSIIIVGCATSKKTTKENKDLKRLVSYMNGAFNSSAQAKVDTNYFDISLHMASIWKNKAGNWLYVEQAVTKNLQKPYRQRVYKVEQVDAKTFKSNVYTIKNQEKWIEKWKNPNDLDVFSESDIELKDGCAVVLTLQADGSFSGSTVGAGCESNLRGATYATSKVTVTQKGIESWDQGFNKEGKQVWGATLGAYKFLKDEDK